jgi:hypothetical protein
MQINWTIITYIVVGYFAIAGFSRGWWKEAITTVVLTILILFLQNPSWAESVINAINNLLSTIWSYLPASVTPVINDAITTVFATETEVEGPFQIDPTSPQTWLIILAIVIGAAILFGRISFDYEPTGLGRLFGAIIGGFNGLLILNLVREYLDGRALPGRVASTSELRLVGQSAFGPAASGVSLQATNLPSYTILDSALPWIAIAIGAFFLISILRTRVGIARSADGSKIQTRIPPFYRPA